MTRIFLLTGGTSGGALGRALHAQGHQVTIVDDDAERVAALAFAGYDARPDLRLVGEPESLILLALPVDGENASGVAGFDLTALRRGAQQVARALIDADSRHVVVVRSPVPPGTTDGMVRHVLERTSGRRLGQGFHLVSAPELRASGGRRPPTVIGAADPRVADRVAGVLEPFGGTQYIVGDAATAEMITAVHGLQRATETRFWSEIAAASAQFGIGTGEVERVLRGSAHLGITAADVVAGADAARDAAGFLGFAADRGLTLPLLSAVVAGGEPRRSSGRPLAAVPRRRPADSGPVATPAPGSATEEGFTLDARSVAVSNGRV